ncbi:MAG TPA: alpha/beta fold hydrolase [Opitutaceae bacterium]|nr:alpha/beta fold hydrolase [Opitutaceae bacterium]
MNAELTNDKREVVILLHGVSLNRWFMRPIARRLEAAGYDVLNLAYPSRRVPLEKLAADWLPAQLMKSGIQSAQRVSFVAHSMGSLLVRHYVEHSCPKSLGRVVFIAPPNCGAELADSGQPKWLFKAVIGINLQALGMSDDAFWRRLPPRVHYPVGTIAGTGHGNPFGRRLPNPNDGTVTVESTRLEGATDSLELPWSHTAILFHKRTADEALHFLRHGRFDHGDPASDAGRSIH